MADASRLFKVDFHVTHLDSDTFVQRSGQIASHQTESDGHLVQRLLAWAIFQDHQITLSRSVCIGQEPDLYVRRNAFQYKHWIQVDSLQLDRLEKAEAKSEHVWLFYCQPDKGAKLLKQINKHPMLQLVEIDPTLIERLSHQLTHHLQWSIFVEHEQIRVATETDYIEAGYCLHHPLTVPALDLIS
ncbi:YaeQ family protein [Gayadomonas joobiniege]|uniref:YaeQ family protein n=1 Tax=Gayadomonas joobiniege TaxID=1234606 RepID=UPI0003790BB9|nr:YaeQ family protein [Gayadomonas joobiniege]